MAGDRVVKVSLTAQVSNYVSGMEQARKSTVAAGTSAEDAKAKFEAQNQAMTQIGTGLLAIGALAAVGVGLAVKKFADFDQAMSNVNAATHESADNMGLLRDAALEAGARTVFTATDAANAIEELSKAGVSTADVLGGALSGSLDLASAGSLGVAEAATIAATALTQFKLNGADIPHVADLLAAGAGKAQGSVDDLGQALKQGGLVASQAGMSLDETTGALAAFASAGLIGSDAGTSLKTMLLALEKPSTQAAGLMEQYGISVYDSQGKMLGFSGIAGQLKDKLGGLTDQQRNSALATIFGTDAVRSASVLYDQGADGIQKWNDKVNDAGYAAETAALRLDNLKGDIEQLSGSIDTALIKSGSAANDTLRFLAKAATDAVNAFSAMPVPIQASALGIGALTAAVALGAGTFLTVVPKVFAYRTALAQLGPTAQTAGRAVGIAMTALGTLAAVGAAIAVINQLDKTLQGTGISVTDLANAFTKGNINDAVEKAFLGAGSFTDSTVKIDKFGKALDNVAKSGLDTRWAGVFGPMIGWLDGTDEATDVTRDALDKMGETFAGMSTESAQKSMRLLRDEYNLTDAQVLTLINNSGPYKDALIAQADKAGMLANDQTLLNLSMAETTATTSESTAAYQDAAAKVNDLESTMRTLMETIDKANGKGRDAITANIGYQQSLADVDAQIAEIQKGTEGYSATLDITSQAGRDNKAMLVDLATANSDAALAQFNLDGDTEKYKQTLIDGHQAVLDRSFAIDGNAASALALADEIRGIPTDTQLKIFLDQAQANAAIAETARQLEAFTARWQNTPITMSLFLDTSRGDRGMAAAAARYTAQALAYANGAYAEGGILPGRPSSKDNLFIHAASGEFVTNARSTADPANRRALEYMNRGGTISGYANGGMVRPEYVSSGSSGGNYSTTTGDTFQATFQLAPVAGRSLADQAFEAARRMKIRR